MVDLEDELKRRTADAKERGMAASLVFLAALVLVLCGLPAGIVVMTARALGLAP